ncbi:MAG: signal peptidase I [Oscillospiraceae bacterium]|nr:signal peptidase I [Oscillospiraceae bacterium]
MEKQGRDFPSIEILEAELKKERYKRSYRQALKSTIYSLLVVAAIAVIVTMLILPVLQISGSSMSDTLEDGDIVVALKGDCHVGDVVGFYFNNSILIKRVIATSGDWVNIDEKGAVYVNGSLLDEPYVKEKALGDCNITLPYQVPDGKYFLMGDHRSTSVDSRNTAVGCIEKEMVVGRLLFRVWPLDALGRIR